MIGTLTDTGPLFALVDAKGQPEQNVRCHAVIRSLSLPLVTTWPCFTEALYLGGKHGRWTMQNSLWRLWRNEGLRIHVPSEASLIALAESAGCGRIFSIDSDFYVYRLADGTALEVIPGPLPGQGR